MSAVEKLREILSEATPPPWLPESTGVCPHCGADDCWYPDDPIPNGHCENTDKALYSAPHSDADHALLDAAPEALALLLGFVDEIKAACSPARGTPPDVWGATKDDVIEDIHAALARLDGTP